MYIKVNKNKFYCLSSVKYFEFLFQQYMYWRLNIIKKLNKYILVYIILVFL